MKWLLSLLSAVLLLVSPHAYAEFSSAECNNIVTSQNFSVNFRLSPATHRETVYVTKRNESGFVAIWSNNSSVRRVAIRDTQTRLFGHYNITLQYESNTAKRGVLTYYLERGGSWVEIDSVEADITDLSAAIQVSGDNVSQLECSEDIAFPQPQSLDLCDYFPDAIQTNRYFVGFPFASDVVLGGDRNKLYLAQRTPISYNAVYHNVFASSGCVYGTSGSVSGCNYNPFLSYPSFPPTLPTFQPGTSDVYCNNSCEQTLTPGRYRNVTIGSNHSTIVLTDGEYWIETLNFATNDAALQVSGQAVVHYKRLLINGDRAEINASGSADNLLLVGHGVYSGITNYYHDVTAHAHLYIDDAALMGGSTGLINYGDRFYWQGAITSSRVRLGGHDGQIHAYAPQSCSLTGNQYAISMSPNTDISLMCGDDRPEFTITTTNNASAFSTQVRVTVVDSSGNSVSGVGLEVVDDIGSGSANTFTTNSDGKLRLQVVSSDFSSLTLNQSYTIQATLVQDTSQSDTSTFSYVPFKFAIDDQQIIAGQATTINAQVLACTEDGQQQVASNYSGQPQVNYQVDYPSQADGGINGNLEYQPSFSSGVSSDDLTLDEVGQFTVTLSDSRFDCSSYASCPIDGEEQLQGSFTLYSRPWTFALCGDDLQSGTSQGGEGFVAAGENFDLTAQPIRYVASADADYCDSDFVTQNYFYSDASVELSYQLDSPSNGELGTLTASSGLSQVITASDAANLGYMFDSLSYDEAGSIDITVTETGAFYSDILQGISASHTVGRFYPAAFQVVGNQWDYPDSQSFVYMNQPFEQMDYQVEALNAQLESLHNYALFSSDLQAQFDVYDPDYPTRFNMARQAGNWQVVDGRSIGYFSQQKGDDCSDSPCWSKAADFAPDGPFNLNTSSDTSSIQLVNDLVVGDGADNIDPVEFSAQTDALLPNQPDIRFGRMRIDSVGGIEGQSLSVPLYTEYWNGQKFTINHDDDATNFNGSHFCSQVVWSEGGSGAYLSGSSTVSSGSSAQLFAAQNSSGKEQVRFWLRLDSPETSGECTASTNVLPWLRFDWNSDNIDEEDPSAVVTFGLYRGNDKVIFRGERGFTGQ